MLRDSRIQDPWWQLLRRRLSPGGTPMIRPEDYARWRASSLGATTDRLEGEALLTMAGDLRGQRVLDVGCGDGFFTTAMWQRGATVIGADLSAEMLAAARHRAESHGAQIMWVRAAEEHLPFRPGEFDVVMAVTVLCFISDPQHAVREMARALRPQGRLLLGELGEWSLWAIWRRLRGWFGVQRWRAAHFFTLSEMRQLTEGAGLRLRLVRGCIYYPPVGLAARALSWLDPLLSRLGATGAAFIAISADKPGDRLPEFSACRCDVNHSKN
jgi:2-polyprenyl-3-methyl-5-hydroxy-6-metoxy-1,4-benzoquinol methylase